MKEIINQKFSDGLEFIPDIGRSSVLGEVFTPKYIVEKILKFADIKNKSSLLRIFEPASGHGNFGVEILNWKIKSVIREMMEDCVSDEEWTTEYEIRSILAVGSLYQNDIDFQNIQELKGRLSRFIFEKYKKFSKNSKKEIPTHYDVAISSILSNNCLQFDMLSKKINKIKFCLYTRSKENKKKIARFVCTLEEIKKNQTNEQISLFNDDVEQKKIIFDEILYSEWKHLICGMYNISNEQPK